MWEPINIAQTGRKLGISSDARYRFERGVDPNFMVPGLELATQMVLDLVRRRAVGQCVGRRRRMSTTRPVEFPVDEVKRLAGLDVSLTEMKRILGHLGFFVAGSGRRRESRRAVLARPISKARPTSSKRSSASSASTEVPLTPFDRSDAPRRPVLTTIQNRTRKAKRALAARALAEAVTWSFISKPQAELFGGGQPELALANPIASDLSDMRPSLIPGLVAAPQRNADRGLAGCRPVRSRPDLQGRPAGGSVHRCRRLCAMACRAAPALAAPGRKTAVRPTSFDAKADALAAARRRRRTDAGTADRARWSGMVSSGPLRRDPDGTEERIRLLRRIASARAGSARRPMARSSASK